MNYARTWLQLLTMKVKKYFSFSDSKTEGFSFDVAKDDTVVESKPPTVTVTTPADSTVTSFLSPAFSWNSLPGQMREQLGCVTYIS